MDIVTLALARKYVEETAKGLGAVKGSPCTIKSITEGENGSTVVFAWTGADGVEQTSSTILPRGPKGKEGDPGEPGVSPTAAVSAIDGGHRVTITDAAGTHTFDVLDGKPGQGGSGVDTEAREQIAALREEKMTAADYTEEVGTSFIDPSLFSNASLGTNGGKFFEYTTGKSYASCREFVPIDPGTAYTCEYANTVPVALYADLYADADESTWISRTLQYANSSNSRVHKFQTPNNAKYIRFCFYKEGENYADVKPISMLLYITDDGPVLEGERVISAGKVDIVGIHEKMVSEGLIDGDMPVPAYYKDASYLSNKVNRIRELLDGCAGDGDAFMFITDQHWEINARNSPALMNYIAKHVHIPRVFSGGDTSDTLHEQYANALSAAFSGYIHHCSGNHDWGSSGAMNGNKLAYIWDMGKREQIGNAKRHYYYVDNPQQSIRYIVLCAYSNETGSLVTAYDEEQINWLRDVALNVESGWTVLVFTHSLYYGFGVNAAISPSPEGATTVIEVLDAATCDVACVIQGHAHLDRIVHTTGGIPVVLTTSDKYMPWMSGETNNEPWLSETRTAGTITEQAFDVVVLDKAARKLTFVRIGAPADNWVDGTSTGTVEERVVSY